MILLGDYTICVYGYRHLWRDVWDIFWNMSSITLIPFFFMFAIPMCLTYLLTHSTVQSPSWEANWFAASQEIPHISQNLKFITALTSVRHLYLFWASPIQSIHPHPTSWRSILILSTHLRLCLPSGLLPSGFPTKTLYTPLSSPICTTCPTHLILLDFIAPTILGEQYKSFSSSLCSLLHHNLHVWH